MNLREANLKDNDKENSQFCENQMDELGVEVRSLAGLRNEPALVPHNCKEGASTMDTFSEGGLWGEDVFMCEEM